MPTVETLRTAGEIGGRTVQIEADGSVACATYDPAPLPPGAVRIRTVRSAVSPGTEATFIGRTASNVHLSKRWDEELRLFVAGRPGFELPMPFGYRAAGVVVDSSSPGLPIGSRVWGTWRHTELVAMPSEQAASQLVPDSLSWDDAVDIGQMGPICINAAAFGVDNMADGPAVVLGAGPIGLITAQVLRASGASRVIVVDRLASRLAIASDLDMDVLEASGSSDVASAVKRRFGANGIPVAWECSGALPALNEAIRMVARKGMVVAVGFYQGPATPLLLGEEFHHNGVSVVSAQIGNPFGSLTRRDLQIRILELVAEGRVTLGGLPRTLLPVDQAAMGFALLKRPDDVLQVAFAYDTGA